MRFEWDNDKSEANRLKHGISFLEATALFRFDHITLELSGLLTRKDSLLLVVWIKNFIQVFLQNVKINSVSSQ